MSRSIRDTSGRPKLRRCWATPERRGKNWVGAQDDFHSLVDEMVEEDLKAAERDALVTQHGYAAYNVQES